MVINKQISAQGLCCGRNKRVKVEREDEEEEETKQDGNVNKPES